MVLLRASLWKTSHTKQPAKNILALGFLGYTWSSVAGNAITHLVNNIGYVTNMGSIPAGDGNFHSLNLLLNLSNENQVSLVRFQAYNPSGSDCTISSRSKSATGSPPYSND